MARQNNVPPHSNDGHSSRGRSRHSFSSTRSSSTATTLTSGLTLENANTETYSGATFEAVPSSIVSFHHPHSLQSSNYFGSVTSNNNDRRGRHDSVPLISRSRAASGSSSRAPHFNFFTEEQLTNAEGSSTLENTDFNVTWDPTPTYEQERIYGTDAGSRRSSIRSFSPNSQQHSYGSSNYSGHPLTRAKSLNRQNRELEAPEVYQSSTHSSSSLSRYTITDRIPIELEEQGGEILDNRSEVDSSNVSETSNASSDNANTNNGANDDTQSHHNKKNAYQNEFLKPEYHEKFYPQFSPEQKVQRFYVAEEDLVIGIAGYKYSKFRLMLYNILCVLSFGMFYLLLRWMPGRRVKFYGVKCPLGLAEWVVIENGFGEFTIEYVKREWYNRPLSTMLYLETDIGLQDTNTTFNHHHVSQSNPNIPILISFEYRYIKFLYSPLEDIFKTNNNWTDPDWVDLPSVYRGLPAAVQEDRIMAFEKNQINLKVKTTAQILFDEVLHPFYVFQIFSIILWSLDAYYYYAGCIFIISIMSIINSLVETKRTSKNLADMSHFSCEVRVFREGFWITVNSNELVPGDVYEISDPSLTVFPCDSVLLSGDCIVNESMLTGESVPVSKTPASEETMYQLLDDFQNTQISSFLSKSFLFNGTIIIRTRVPPGQSAALAMVARTGFSTTKGALVRSMVFPKPTGFKFYRDSFKYIGVMTIIALLGFSISWIQFIKIGLDKRTMILRALDIITVVVPPALPATLTIGTSFALNRLKKKGIFCISPTRVNIGGKIDVMCFDKTGTLTEDGLDVLGVQLSEPGPQNTFKFGNLKYTVTELFDKFSLNDCSSPIDFKSRNFLMSLLTCHSLRVVDSELIGDPLDFKMFQFTKWSYEEDFQKQTFHSMYEGRHEGSIFPENTDIIPAVVHPNGSDKDNKYIDNDPHNFLGIIRSFEFLSELRRMSVIVKPNSEDRYWAFTKGAPEVISEICNKTTLPSNYDEILHQYTHNGYRVIACAGKILPKHTWLYSQKVSREEVEMNMEFMGFIIFENKLKKATEPTLKVLHNANIRVVMCTGDNILTAISVGRSSGLIRERRVFVPYLNDEQTNHLVWRDVDDYNSILDGTTLRPININESDYTLGVTGEVFRLLFTNENEIPESYLNEILLKSSIFARMSPDEKHELTEQLQRLDYTVGFCGDGANDCGALKAADVGISLSEAEASVAAPFTSQIFDIGCVLDVIKEGRAALVTSFACFQYMSLYSAIQFVTISILYGRGSNLGDFQFLYIDLFLIIPIAIFMSWSGPYENIVKKRPSANLVSFKILTPLFVSFGLTLLFQVIPWLLVQRTTWYIKPIVGGDDFVQSSDNTVLFFVSNFQYILVAVILSVGPPYRQPMSQNIGFILDIFISTVISVALMSIKPDTILGRLFQLTGISTGFKYFIVIWAVINYICQSYIPNATKHCFRKKISSKKYKNILRNQKGTFSV